MKHHRFHIIAGLILLFLVSNNILEAQISVQWNSWEEGIQKAKQSDKPILVSIYNRGCTWCRHMDNTTFSDLEIQQYIAEKFIPIALNIEEKAPIEYNSKDYNLIQKGDRSYHELAIDLTGGRYGTPAMIFLDKNGEVLQSLIGYKDVEKFKNILVYYGESHYKNIPWCKFLKTNEND